MRLVLHFKTVLYSTLISLGVILSGPCYAQNPFQIVWTFDETMAGSSNNPNFIASPAVLSSGVSIYNLNGGYGIDIGSDKALIINQTWPTAYSDDRYVEMKFTPQTYEYNLSSVNVRLRRSGTGPKYVKLTMTISKFKSTVDSVTVDLATFSLPTDGVFVPSPSVFSKLNQYSTYTFRLHGFEATSSAGTLWVNNFTVSGDRTDFILPVNLTYFNAQAAGGQVGLAWETAWEQNSKEFIVQRSTDLKEFGDIGTVAAMGQTEGRQIYRFTDPSPALGTNYYRLRMVDEDGSYEYSKVKDVINRPNEPVLLVSPNPVSNQTIRLRTFMLENSTLKLSTILGQNIPFSTNDVGNNTVELVPTSTLSPGIYIISAQRDGIRVHSQLIVP